MDKIEIRDLRQKEQFILDDAFLNGYARLVGIYAVGVYCSLCRHANKEQTSWPSLKTISEELNISRDSVWKALSRLEEYGIIVKIRVGKMANNRYILTSKRTWKSISDVRATDISSPPQRSHQSATAYSNSKEPQSKEPQVTGEVGTSQVIERVSEDERPQKARADTTYRKVFDLWPDHPLQWRTNRTEIEAAKNLLVESTIEDMSWALKEYKRFKSDPYCPTILSPIDLDRKWDKLMAYRKKHG